MHIQFGSAAVLGLDPHHTFGSPDEGRRLTAYRRRKAYERAILPKFQPSTPKPMEVLIGYDDTTGADIATIHLFPIGAYAAHPVRARRLTVAGVPLETKTFFVRRALLKAKLVQLFRKHK